MAAFLMDRGLLIKEFANYNSPWSKVFKLPYLIVYTSFFLKMYNKLLKIERKPTPKPLKTQSIVKELNTV